MDTIRELIIAQFITRAAAIKKSGGYLSDCGLSVFRADVSIPEESVPYLVVIPQVELPELMSGKQFNVMPVDVVAVHYFGAKAVELGHATESLSASVWGEKLLGDLIKCFSGRDWDRRRIVASPASPVTYLSRYDDSIQYAGGGVPSYPEDGSVTVGALATFNVSYYTLIGDPFSQEEV